MSTHEGFWTANGEFCLLDARANENFNLLLMYSQLFLHDALHSTTVCKFAVRYSISKGIKKTTCACACRYLAALFPAAAGGIHSIQTAPWIHE